MLGLSRSNKSDAKNQRSWARSLVAIPKQRRCEGKRGLQLKRQSKVTRLHTPCCRGKGEHQCSQPQELCWRSKPGFGDHPTGETVDINHHEARKSCAIRIGLALYGHGRSQFNS